MHLPTTKQAIQQISELAEAEELDVSRRVRKHMDNLGYLDADVCDMLYELTESDCEKIAWSHREPYVPVATFCAVFTPRDREIERTDRLFVEVAIQPDKLYLLACKLYGSPE